MRIDEAGRTPGAPRPLRILSVSAFLPFPPNNGTRNRTWNLVSRLAETQEVTLLTWCPPHMDPAWIAELERVVHRVIVPPYLDRSGGAGAKVARRVRSTVRQLPTYVTELLDRAQPPQDLQGPFDIAIAEDDASLLLMPDVDCPIVVHRHNVFSQTVGGLIEADNLGLARKLKWKSEMGIWRRFDSELARRADLSIVTTEVAKQSLLGYAPDGSVEVVPNGVDMGRPLPAAGRDPVVVFVGKMDYEPNADAVVAFAKGVWPKVVARFPEAVFRIVGSDPPAEVRKLAGAGIEVTGTVEDIEAACEGARVAVVPLNAGSGIKTKTLTSMALGLPVIATPQGREGVLTGRQHGVLEVKDEDEMAEAVVEVLSDAALAKSLGARARAQAQRFSWKDSTDRYIEVLRGLAGVTTGTNPPSRMPSLRVIEGSAKTRILFVNGTGERAGAERMLLHLLSSLDRERFEPCVAFLGDGPFVQEVSDLGVPVLRLGQAPRLRRIDKWSGIIRRIQSAIEETGADVVHANGEKVSILAGRAAKLAGVQCVSWLHDAPGGGGAAGWAAQAALALVKVDQVVTCARWMEEEFNRTLRLGATAIPNCIDLMNLPEGKAVIDQIKRGAGWSEDTLVVGHFARLQRWKGTEHFLRAAAELLKTRPDVRFLVVGDVMFGREAAYGYELKELATALGLDGKVVFTGYRPDALEVMAGTDVVVHCSTAADPFPLVVLEGMSLGLPVVATKSKGPEEAITHGETGLLVPCGNVASLVEAVGSLVDSDLLRLRLGRNARRFAMQKFSAPLMAHRFESLYDRLTGRLPELADQTTHADLRVGLTLAVQPS